MAGLFVLEPSLYLLLFFKLFHPSGGLKKGRIGRNEVVVQKDALPDDPYGVAAEKARIGSESGGRIRNGIALTRATSSLGLNGLT